MRGVADEDRAGLVPAVHAHVAVLAEEDLAEVVDLLGHEAGARLEAQDLVAEGAKARLAPRGYAIGPHAPEQAHDRRAVRRGAPGGQKAAHALGMLHRLRDLALEDPVGIRGDEPQRAPGVRSDARPDRGVVVELGDRAVGDDDEVEGADALAVGARHVAHAGLAGHRLDAEAAA